MPAPLLSGGAIAAGNLISAGAGASAARRQNRILAGGSRQQNRAGMEAAGVTGDFLSQLRSSAPNPAIERGAFTDAMRGAPGISGPGGAQFRTDAADVTGAAQGYGQQLADLFARIRAPGLQRQNEGRLMMRAGDALRPIQMRAEGDAFLTNLRAGMVQPDPLQQLFGQGVSNLGSYYMGQP